MIVFHPAPDRTYRLFSDVTNKEGQDFSLASTPLPLAGALTDNNAFIEKSTRLYPLYVKQRHPIKSRARIEHDLYGSIFF
jgi:hypothetical protein